MPEYLRPGVFIEEIERGPRPIEGVPTSTSAFLGQTERGPIKPRLVTSYRDYQRWFGGVFSTSRYMPFAANGFFENGGRRLFACRIVAEDAEKASRDAGAFRIDAVGAGSWGDRVWVRVLESTTKTTDDAGNVVPIGFRVQVAYWSNFPNGFTPFDPFVADNDRETPRPALTEDFDDLVINAASPDYWEKRITDNSALIELVDVDEDGSLPAFDTGVVLSGGSDGSADLDVADFAGLPNGLRDEPQGLTALELDQYRDVALVYAPRPAAAADDIARAVINHCEMMRFRFAVVDPAANSTDIGNFDPRTDLRESQYAAMYFPWIRVNDPESGARRLVPPGGHVLGVFSRTDTERGVFKAPANETLRGAIEPEFEINDRDQEVLNPRGVNAIRNFPSRGIRVWGARTLSANTLWKYVPVRRLFIFLERSIYENTQWVVFEPNSDALWARVTDTIRLFLRAQWRAGALFGRTEEEAFFITCDRTTMTQDDILNGRLICEIGIAPVRPAEFVVFRIFQHTAEAQS